MYWKTHVIWECELAKKGIRTKSWKFEGWSHNCQVGFKVKPTQPQWQAGESTQSAKGPRKIIDLAPKQFADGVQQPCNNLDPWWKLEVEVGHVVHMDPARDIFKWRRARRAGSNRDAQALSWISAQNSDLFCNGSILHRKYRWSQAYSSHRIS